MNKKILTSGIVILVIGILLAVLFWPIFGVSGSELEDDQDGLVFESYSQDDTVLVYGTITEITETDFPDWFEEIGIRNAIHVELDDGFSFVIHDEEGGDFSEGDSVYGNLILREESIAFGIGRIEYWEMTGSLRSKRFVDILFYGTIIAGAVITGVGVVKI